MDRPRSNSESMKHKKQAIQKVDTYIESFISSEDTRLRGKSDKFCYWPEDWAISLSLENQFSPISPGRYKRGEVIKVHLGFNIGSKERGLHYAIVLDRSNAKFPSVASTIPPSSVKPYTDISKLKGGGIFLENELFMNLNAKVSATNKHLTGKIKLLTQVVERISDDTFDEKRIEIIKKIIVCRDGLSPLARVWAEVLKMKQGSIVLINQITTAGKIHICDPKTNHDILSGIKLSNGRLGTIDDEIRKKFANLQLFFPDNRVQ